MFAGLEGDQEDRNLMLEIVGGQKNYVDKLISAARCILVMYV